MSRPLDYYAGYPSQQRTPKWLGITLASIFGAVTLSTLAVGVRLVLPTRSAQASMLPAQPKGAVLANDAVLAKDTAPATGAVAVEDEASTVRASAAERAPSRTHRAIGSKNAKKKHGSIALASAKPSKGAKSYKHAQLFAKHVSGSRRDKRSRDDLNRMLGL